jgi:ketosteroid isomerase-like protein
MKRIFFVAAFVLIASVFAFGQKDAKATEAKLIQMDRDWTAAELRGDMKTISTYVADDFWGTTPDGQMQNKKQYLDGIKATKDTDVADEYSVRFFGPDVAVMTHRGTVKGEQPLQYRSTHVWVNRGGKWQIVAHHSSEVAPAPDTPKAAAPAARKAPKIAPLSASPAASDAKPE